MNLWTVEMASGVFVLGVLLLIWWLSRQIIVEVAVDEMTGDEHSYLASGVAIKAKTLTRNLGRLRISRLRGVYHPRQGAFHLDDPSREMVLGTARILADWADLTDTGWNRDDLTQAIVREVDECLDGKVFTPRRAYTLPLGHHSNMGDPRWPL